MRSRKYPAPCVSRNPIRTRTDKGEKYPHGNYHNEGRNTDLLQGLGDRAADRVFSRLAADRGRLGRANAVLRTAWLSRNRARPARPWPLEPDLGWQRYGYLRRRSRGAIQSA